MSQAKTILVTGGAGYIGSHACKALADAGYVPVAYDNLTTGWADAVQFGPLERGDLLDRDMLAGAFARHKPVAVMHFAAASDVAESGRNPGKYWRNNVSGSLNLIEAMLAADCKRLVFSSTCAVYRDVGGTVLTEDSALGPVSVYGRTKAAIEAMLADFGASHGLSAVTFRYFNVAGADPDGAVGEFHRPETHLVPLIFEAILGRRAALTVHGTDYETADGTCVRDFVHVVDVIEAHLAGLERLLSRDFYALYNLGTGHGFSVREVIEKARRVTNRPVPIEEGPRRPGDAVSLVAGGDLARRELRWAPSRSTMEQMIADAWAWHRGPGYEA
ncbi:MAG: UDP-glucose 4-epimerase GalE [Pseudomonadota bacterium]